MKWVPSAFTSASTEFKIELRDNRGKEPLYAIVHSGGLIMNRQLELVQEPLPSSRTSDYLAQTRFPIKLAMGLVLAYHEKHDSRYQ